MSLLRQRLQSAYIPTKRTLLGVGPMSLTCVQASAELAREHDVPLMLIASRRQVDAASLGGGYVENWSTEAFAEAVRAADPDGKLILCRDHGGAYQGTAEDKLTLEEATKRAKESYAADIASGFGVIHVDPSIDPTGQARPDQIMDRAFDLMSYCWGEAQRQGRDIVFEVGTEEQTPDVHSPEEIEENLKAIQSFCRREGIPMPLFVVAQTGTKVMETRNIGLFQQLLALGADGGIIETLENAPHRRLPALIEKLAEYDVFLKQHNTDYLTDGSLKTTTSLGVHAANVAPEFGVIETRTILKELENHGETELAQGIMATAFLSGKWNKWMVEHTQATERDKAEIAGHYIFASTDGRRLLTEATERLAAKGVDLSALRHAAVKDGIRRYLVDFGW